MIIPETTEHEEKLLLLYLRFYRLQALKKIITNDLPWVPPEKRERLKDLKRQADEIRAAVIELEGIEA